MIVLKETKSKTSFEYDRRIVINDGRIEYQYRVADRWYQIPCNLSAPINKLLCEVLLEQYAEVQRVKAIAESTANLGEQLVQKIEERQSVDFINKTADEFIAAVPSNVNKVGCYFLDVGYKNGMKDALKGLINGQ